MNLKIHIGFPKGGPILGSKIYEYMVFSYRFIYTGGAFCGLRLWPLISQQCIHNFIQAASHVKEHLKEMPCIDFQGNWSEDHVMRGH